MCSLFLSNVDIIYSIIEQLFVYAPRKHVIMFYYKTVEKDYR